MQIGSRQIKLFQDSADLQAMIAARQKKVVSGFTTNPTLMHKAGVRDYKDFALKAVAAIPDLPISFEVFSDEFDAMEREAREIASWGGDTYVKIPITNTKGQSSGPLIKKLSREGFSLNVTALFTLDQVKLTADVLDAKSRTIVSVFAGRVADTGVDPIPIMQASAQVLNGLPRAELLWASSREALNIVQAAECGCHIITAAPDLIAKIGSFGKDLSACSLEAVRIFYQDANAAGFRIV